MFEGTDALETFDNSRDIFKVESISIKCVYPEITWHSEHFFNRSDPLFLE